MAGSNIAKKRAIAKCDNDSEYVARREKLIKIAAELFQERGYAATRPLDIAKRAGLDRASLYYYIGGKEELFRESLGDIVELDLNQARDIQKKRCPSRLGPAGSNHRFAHEQLRIKLSADVCLYPGEDASH